MKTYSPIIRALTTEKSSQAQEKGKYTFMVDKNATKIDIKKAVKTLYGVEVAAVRTNLLQGKVRILKGKYEWMKRPMIKKAIVTLKGKKTIDQNKIGSSGEKSAKPTAKAKKKSVKTA